MNNNGPNLSLARAVLLAMAACLLLTLSSAETADAGAPPPFATGIKVAHENGRTRFLVEVSRAVSFNVYVLPDPYRAIVDLPELEFRLPRDAGGVPDALVSGYRFGRLEKDRSRIVIDAVGPVLIDKSFVVHAKDGKPAQLVIELVATDAETFARIDRSEAAQDGEAPPPDELAPVSAEVTPNQLAAAENESPEKQTIAIPRPQPRPDRAEKVEKPVAPPVRRPNGQRVVVIDPGHGGIDPGAIGVKGTAEKEVVLAFARELTAALQAGGRYKIVLTRSEDVFLSLRDRVRVARNNNADLLIALHADALRRAGTRGATVYTLSDRGSDAEAEALAQKENRADIIGGVDLGAESEEITGILIDLAQRETRNHSTVFAKHLAKELKPVTRLTSRPIRSAGFRVLKAPDVPSVLLELGYLSSKPDEALLTSPDWRKRLAKSVSAAIDQYFATQLAAGH